MLPSATLKRLCRARDLMRDCYTEPLTLHDICAEAHFSSFHFLRLFNHAFGETPHRFLTRFRLERAKDLLIVSNRSVTEVCLEVGFESVGSFSTLFTRHIGMSPASFRKQARAWVRVPGRHPWTFIPFCFAQALGAGR